MHSPKNILITGGSGFIGSNLIQYIFNKTSFTGRIVNLDVMTYAANPRNLEEVEAAHLGKRYFFIAKDICDEKAVQTAFREFNIDTVIHLAAETHVDRSISGPGPFIHTNINGTFNLLETARLHWGQRKDVLFHHVSTDEVFGSLGPAGYFTEETAYDPKSPYSASKASSDHMVRAYFNTYDLPITLSNCSNNYGPRQYPEKLIPLMILNMTLGKPLPIYGDGKNIRDWLYVEDHCDAVWTIVTKATPGESYNIGGNNELENIQLMQTLCKMVASTTGKPVETYLEKIVMVKDRPGHDRRYAIDSTKIKTALGWTPRTNFETGLRKTIEWYLSRF